MNLVQILLPTADNDGEPFPSRQFDDLRRELTERFGGVTVYSQGLAKGFWKDGEDTSRDSIVIFEVMAETVDKPWWIDLRERLEAEFLQDEIVVRAQEIQRL